MKELTDDDAQIDALVLSVNRAMGGGPRDYKYLSDEVRLSEVYEMYGASRAANWAPKDNNNNSEEKNAQNPVRHQNRSDTRPGGR